MKNTRPFYDTKGLVLVVVVDVCWALILASQT